MSKLIQYAQRRLGPNRKWLIALIAIGGIGAVMWMWVVRPPQYFSQCHRGLDLSLDLWMLEMTPNTLPNIEGDSMRSLSVLAEWQSQWPLGIAHINANKERMLSMWKEQHVLSKQDCAYMYVPGLTSDDPGDMVVFYVRKPTRHRWHGDHPTLLRPKRWVVIPVDRSRYTGGECSEWMTTSRFLQALTNTLLFIHANNRPHWESIINEHCEFISAIDNDLAKDIRKQVGISKDTQKALIQTGKE